MKSRFKARWEILARSLEVFNSLPVKLSIYISSILLVIFILGALVIGHYGVQRFSITLNRHGITTAEQTASQLNQIFVQAELTSAIVAKSLERNTFTKETLTERVQWTANAMHQICPELTAIVVAYNEGMLVAGEKYNAFASFYDDLGFHSCHLTDETFDYYNMDWFAIPVSLEQPIWTVPFCSHILHNKPQVLGFVTPFYKTVDDQRKVAGVIIVDIPIHLLEKYLPRLKLAGDNLAGAGRSFLMNQFGQLVLFPGSDDLVHETLYTLCEMTDHPDPQDRQTAKNIFRQSDQSGSAIFQKLALLNEPTEFFYARCVNRWMVGIVVQADWISETTFPLVVRFALGCLLGTLLTTIIIFAICRRLNRPLVLLSKVAESIGQGNFSADLPEINDTSETLRLSQSFRKMQKELIDYLERLQQTIVARERAEGELTAARIIQQDILPQSIPPFSTCPNVRCFASLTPARGVGGDLYDVFMVDSQQLAIIIGDVSGKGVPAALFMAVTQTLQRSIASTEKNVDQLVIHLNEMLSQHNNSGMFVTYWVGFLNINTGKLWFVNAGHNNPVIRKNSGEIVELQQKHGFPLGIAPDFEYESDCIMLEEGDTLVLYTDGVTEAFNANNEQYGFCHLTETIQHNNPTQRPEELVTMLLADVDRHAAGFGQSDDITLMAIQYETASTIPTR